MNELKIKTEIPKFTNADRAGYGCIYAIKLINGLVKIGASREPIKRIKTHSNQIGASSAIDRVFVSNYHFNYRQNELRLIDYIGNDRKEYAVINFDKLICFAMSFVFEVEDECCYNARKELKIETDKKVLDTLAGVIYGDYCDKNNDVMLKSEYEQSVIKKIQMHIAHISSIPKSFEGFMTWSLIDIELAESLLSKISNSATKIIMDEASK